MIEGFDKTRYELYDDAEVEFKLTIGSRTMAGVGKVLDVNKIGDVPLFFVEGTDRASGQRVWLNLRVDQIVDVIKLGELAEKIIGLEVNESGSEQLILKKDIVNGLDVLKYKAESMRQNAEQLISNCNYLIAKYSE